MVTRPDRLKYGRSAFWLQDFFLDGRRIAVRPPSAYVVPWVTVLVEERPAIRWFDLPTLEWRFFALGGLGADWNPYFQST